MNKLYKNLTICTVIIFISFIILSNFQWTRSSLSQLGMVEPFVNDQIQSSYNLLYTADGVKDVIKIKDPQSNASVTYVDDITRLNYSMCPEGFVYDKHLGCKTECPSGMIYDQTIQACTHKCLPFQDTKYSHDTSASCVAKCNPIQYYDIFTKKCNNCPIGYTGDGNNNCIDEWECPEGQRVTDNYGTCKGCHVGQQMDASFQCHDICKSHQKYDEDGSCALRCPNPNQYSDPLYGCINCPVGYLVDDHNVCKPRPACPIGQFLDNAGIECISECSIYDRYDVNTHSCVPICGGFTPIYDAQSRECVPCPDGQIYSGSYNKCIAPHTPLPATCDPGFTAINGICKSICPDWRINDRTNPGTCNLMCPSKTQYFDTVTSYGCVDCPPGYTVDSNNVCQAPPPTPPPPPPGCDKGYMLNTVTGQCDSICSDWRINDPHNPIACMLRCPNSNQIYDISNNRGCINCPTGWRADNFNRCSIPPPAPPPTTPPPITIATKQVTNVTNSSNSTSTSTSTTAPTLEPTLAPTLAPTCTYKNRGGMNDDYQNTCYDITTSDNGTITAKCENFKQVWIPASINSCTCNGRIRNVGGQLVCQ